MAEQVDDDRAVPLRQAWHDARPQMRGRETAMNEHDRLARASGSGGVVIEPRAADIDELASHAMSAATMRPAIAEAATVYGDARYS
jgi:hypothetical protein